MEWYSVPEPKTVLEPFPSDGEDDAEHFRDEFTRRFKRYDFLNGANSQTWWQLEPPPSELDCTRFDCGAKGQHEWDEEPARVYGRAGAVQVCRKGKETEDDIRGYLETRIFRFASQRTDV